MLLWKAIVLQFHHFYFDLNTRKSHKMHSKKIYFATIIVISVINTSSCEQKEYLSEKTGQTLISDTSSEVSKLVSRAFRSVPKPTQKDSGVVSALLKLMGLEGRKIGAIAVNSIVMVSQLIANNLIMTSGPEKHTEKNGNVIKSIIELILSKQSENSDLFKKATEGNFLNDLTDSDQNSQKHLICTKLLICKIKPFVKEMQKSVVNMIRQEKELIMNDKSMLNFPSMEVLIQEFNSCDTQHPDCIFK